MFLHLKPIRQIIKRVQYFWSNGLCVPEGAAFYFYLQPWWRLWPFSSRKFTVERCSWADQWQHGSGREDVITFINKKGPIINHYQFSDCHHVCPNWGHQGWCVWLPPAWCPGQSSRWWLVESPQHRLHHPQCRAAGWDTFYSCRSNRCVEVLHGILSHDYMLLPCCCHRCHVMPAVWFAWCPHFSCHQTHEPACGGGQAAEDRGSGAAAADEDPGVGKQDEGAGVGAGPDEGEEESGTAEGEGLQDEEGLLQSQAEEAGGKRAAVFLQQQRRRGENNWPHRMNYGFLRSWMLFYSCPVELKFFYIKRDDWCHSGLTTKLPKKSCTFLDSPLYMLNYSLYW